MADYSFEAQPRTIIGKKVRQLRNQGLVPIVVYGPNIQPQPLQVPYRQLEVTLMQAGGTNLIDLKVDGKSQSVIAREVQRDILKGTILHADFFAVDEDSTIVTDVHLTLAGESPIVASRAGMLLTGTNTVTIETLPRHLVDHIEVDITGLAEIGDAIYVRDLALGDNVRILNDPDEMIVRIAQPAAARAESAEEEEAEQALTSGEVEVIGRGKRDEDEDEE